jgi:VWFA-related protein
MRPLRCLLYFVVAVLVCGPAARGQSSPWRPGHGHVPGIAPRQPEAFAPQEASVGHAEADRPAPTGGREMVKFAFTVRDKKDRLVLDLTQEELRVFEDGKEQKIEYFSPELSLPLNLGLLIDLSGSQRGRVTAAAQSAAESFFRRVLRKGDQAFVIGFQEKAYLVSDFTDSPDDLRRAVRKTSEIKPSGGTRLQDIIAETCRDKLANKPGRKTLVIISDGEDNASRMTRDEAVQAATRAGTVIYVIFTPQPSASGGFAHGAVASRYLSERTGGRESPIVVEKDFANAFNEIAEDLVNQYTVGYYSANAAQPGSVRRIKIQSTRKDLRFFGPQSRQAPKP